MKTATLRSYAPADYIDIASFIAQAKLRYSVWDPQATMSGIYLISLRASSTWVPLAPFGPDRQLVFALGDHEYAASIGANGTLYFDDLQDINLLEGEDYLAFRLYQNGDDANLLFEYAFADLYIETTDTEFPEIALRWDDYYPALGDKRINIKTRCNLDGQNIRAEILLQHSMYYPPFFF